MTTTTTANTTAATKMTQYEPFDGCIVIPPERLDLRSDSDIEAEFINPPQVPSGHVKNIWGFWHQGWPKMPGYLRRTVLSWHRRLAPLGWTVRVLDVVEGSPANVCRFVDTSSPALFPAAFMSGRVGGEYSPQHVSDLVRLPLLIKYGGVYMDVGFLLFGDLDRLWNATIGDPSSPIESIAFASGDPGLNRFKLANFFLCGLPDNPLFKRAHEIFLGLWAENGGRTDLVGSHKSPLIKQVALTGVTETFTPDGEVSEDLAYINDYLAQTQALGAAQGEVTPTWNGPAYTRENLLIMTLWENSNIAMNMTGWSGAKLFELLCRKVPTPGQPMSAEDEFAMELVKKTALSFSMKLMHGFVATVFKCDTLGMLWNASDISGHDSAPGTYAGLLRHASTYWLPDRIPQKSDVPLDYTTLIAD